MLQAKWYLNLNGKSTCDFCTEGILFFSIFSNPLVEYHNGVSVISNTSELCLPSNCNPYYGNDCSNPNRAELCCPDTIRDTGQLCQGPRDVGCIVQRTSNACKDITADTCEFQFDGNCDAGTLCAIGSDCIDCDLFQQYSDKGCSACTSNGGVYTVRETGKPICVDPLTVSEKNLS